MNVRIFGISGKATLQALKETELSASWQQDDTHRWIDVEAATQDELRQLLEPLDLHASVRNACLKPERSTRFISQRNALYFELPTHLGWDESEKPYLSVICLNTTIITIHRDPLHTMDDIISGLDEEVPLYAQTSSALLYYVLLEVGRCNVDAALDVRAEAERLDQISHESLEGVDPQMISELRRRINHYAAVHDDHIYCTGLLQTVESEAFDASQQSQFFHELLRLSELAGQLIDGAESRVSSLERDYELSLQKRVDNRLRFLTILSAVLMPLTLISGIYGMNFSDLPGMGVADGHLFVIGFMLATALLIGIYMFWRGWFE
jgi:magnesium transporter